MPVWAQKLGGERDRRRAREIKVEKEGERIGRRGRRRPEATTHLVKVRPLSGSWILSTRFFHSLTTFPSEACFSEEDSSWLEEGDGLQKLTLTLAPDPQTWAKNIKQQMWGSRFIGLVFCLFWAMPDKQSDKRGQIKDGQELRNTEFGGRLTSGCVCGSN